MTTKDEGYVAPGHRAGSYREAFERNAPVMPPEVERESRRRGMLARWEGEQLGTVPGK